MDLKEIFHTDLLQKFETSEHIKSFTEGDGILDLHLYARSIPIIAEGKLAKSEEMKKARNFC